MSLTFVLFCKHEALAAADEPKGSAGSIQTEAELIQYMQSNEVQRVLKPASESKDNTEELGPPVQNKNSASGAGRFEDTNPKPVPKAKSTKTKNKSQGVK